MSHPDLPADLPALPCPGEERTGEPRINQRGYDICMDCFAPLTQETHFTRGGLNYCLHCASSLPH